MHSLAGRLLQKVLHLKDISNDIQSLLWPHSKKNKKQHKTTQNKQKNSLTIKIIATIKDVVLPQPTNPPRVVLINMGL